MREESFKNDIDLVEACIKRDLLAWSAFIRKYSNLILISIDNRLKKYGFTLPYQDIEDMKQSILTSIWQERKLESVKNREDISYWLAIVSGNIALKRMRNMGRREPIKPISIFDYIGETELGDLIPSGELTARDKLHRDALSKKIDEALESLPKKEKLIMKLNLYHDKKYHEIARILNLPTGTVSSYAKRAKEKLQKYLSDYR